MLSDLDRGETNTTGTGMDQEPLTGLNSGQMNQRVIRCEKWYRDGTSLVVIEICRFGCQRVFRRDGMGGKCVRHDPQDRIPNLKSIDTLTNRRDRTRRFNAERHNFVPDSGIEPQCLEDIAEIQSCRANLQFDLTRFRDPPFAGDKPQSIERTGRANS